ncbi:unnamed protein product [Fraxinus pennsylvanica]|uniref:Uncharacterized protein n=1 Tax=Fraxinus pennsylvanica TaxID=56036 RepID=A0AAD1ZVM9_9LAMI|nr:unnamed protein product [Fraxinus pennsylvanica]
MRNLKPCFSSIRKDGRSEGPGKVFQILECSISMMKDFELGERISEALQSWSPADIIRRIITGQTSLMSEFLRIFSVKENVVANRSFVDPRFSLELNILLECYAKILEFPFQDAVEIVLGVSSGRKPLEALSTAVVDWMNFAVFFNAWNLNSCEIRLSEKDSSSSGTWQLASCELADEEVFAIEDWIYRDGSSEGPRKVFQILESSISMMKDFELGERISEALQSWSPADITRRIINGQTSLMSEFLRICKLKVKSFEALKLQFSS